MSEAIPIAATKSIRDCGLDEVWLQDQIADNPDCLQLGSGELELVSRERRQAEGGRLDILLKDQDDSMYEVEVMLEKTDETHIIRTIEYWDREKRKWPQRQHFAVLVAESITSRFFNVIQLLSHCIPIIAVQANIIEVDGKRVLHFSKVLDTYEEPELLPPPYEKYDEAYWRERSSWTLDAAKALLEVVRPIYASATLNLVKYYIAIEVNRQNYLWMHKRSGGKSLLTFWVSERLLPQATETLDAAGIPYVQRNQELKITVDQQMIHTNSEVLTKIADLVRKSWEE